MIKQLHTNIEVKYFCGINNIYETSVTESSSLTHFRNRLSKHPEILERIQNIHLKEIIKKIPKKKRWQYDQDSTVIEEKIKYPNDVNLLNDLIQKWWKLIDKCKTVVWESVKDMIAKWRRTAKKLHLIQYTKEQLNDIANNILEIIDTLRNKIRHSKGKQVKNMKKKLNHYIDLWKAILTQQSSMTKSWNRSVKNRIVSLSKTHVRPIVKWKQGKKVQFWTKAHIWVIWWKIAVAVWLSRESEHDSKRIKDWIEIIEKVRWKPPSECWYDKGWRSPESYELLKQKRIKNWIQWSKGWKEHSKRTRKRMYRRRAFNENIINDVLNHRWVNKNKYRQENINWSLLIGCMASNMIRV